MRFIISLIFFFSLACVHAQTNDSADPRGIDKENVDAQSTPSTYYDFTKQDLVHPNPSEGVFYLNSVEEGDDIKVFDGTGRMMYSQEGSNGKTTIDLSHLDKGIYRVLVRDRAKRLKVNQKILIR
jgi:hypothetical protein